MSSANRKPRKGGVRAAKAGASLVAFLAVSVAAGVLISAIVAPGAVAAGSAASTGLTTFNALPDYLKIGPTNQQTTFYANQGGQPIPIAKFYAQNRIDVPLAKMAKTVQDAAIATEDPRFYQEGGIDPIGTVRAFLSNLLHTGGDSVQGGSSITQQYVKNVLVMQCELNNPVSASAPEATQKKQQAALEACSHKVAGQSNARKIQEIRYAMGLSKTYSKSTILQGYLNIIGFGGQVYGVQAAAQYYYGTTADKLTLNQAATLIAIENRPNTLRIDLSAADLPGNNAENHFKATLDRRNYVLDRMLTEKYITQAQHDAAVKEAIEPRLHAIQTGCMPAQTYNAGFFCDYVQRVMLTDPVFGKTQEQRDIFFTQGGLNVYTTLNIDLNTQAQATLNSYIPTTKAAAGFDLGAANVALEVGTGNIIEMVQNKAFDDTASAPDGATSVNYNTPFDYGGSTGFQTGSSFKPFVLAAWLEAGYGVYDSVNASSTSFRYQDFSGSCINNGEPYGYGPFQVANDEGDEGGVMNVLTATKNSVNTAYMQMTTKLDMCKIADLAHSMGVNSADPNYAPWSIVPTQSIGVNAVSPLQMAQAYAGFTQQGKVCTPRAIDHITTTDGKALNDKVPPINCPQVIPANIANGVQYALQRVMTGGTATQALPYGGAGKVMGKTGTTDHQVQNWLVTSTTKVAQATWVGNVQGNTNLRTKSYGGWLGNGVKFPIVKQIQTALDAAYPPDPLPSAPRSVLYGKGYIPPAASPSPSATPTPTQTQAPAPPAAPPAPAPAAPAAPPAPAPNTGAKPAQPPAPAPTAKR